MQFYAKPAEEALRGLGTTKDKGLTLEEAASRREKYGENKLKEAKKKGMFRKFLEQFNDFMVIILIIAAAISFGIAVVEQSGDYIDSIIILAIVIINAIMGVVQENKAEKSLEALEQMSAPTSKVLRGGKIETIPSADLVPGDIILVEAGDFVPADARIIEGSNLQAEESALTGESLPVHKNAQDILPENCVLGDRKNMLFSTTVVTYGHGKAVVTATGMETEVGHIANMLMGEKEVKTPLQKKLAGLGKMLGIVAIAICVLIFVMMSFQDRHYLEAFVLSISLAVAAVPEGLPAIVTIVLAVGVSRMVKKNAIIRKLPAVETLGSTTVICSDKTGTLTQNKMTVVKLCDAKQTVSFEEKAQDLSHIIEYGSLCNDSMVQRDGGQFRVIGDPTETAIVDAGEKMQMRKEDLEQKYPRISDLPFDSNRKLMSTIHKSEKGYLILVKGAYDVITKKSTHVDVNGKIETFSPIYRDAFSRYNDEMASQALRVLGVAYKFVENLPNQVNYDTIENDLVFLGLIGMIDPPRPEVFEAVRQCREAGITPVMITGDHKATAVAIAQQLGILSPGNLALSGEELDQMTDEAFQQKITNIRVYARVSPEHKVKIVKAFKEKGNVVAMTGDGVNDAPALKAADIGCAMGITGTDVAKGAADMVLTDDNFATIVSAVSEGRGVFENIRKTVMFLLSSNIGEIIALFVCIMLGLGSPLLPIHLLWINLVTDSFPALALGVDPIEKDIMKRKPIDSKKGLFSGAAGVALLAQGLMIGLLTLSAYILGGGDHKPVAMTMAFATLSLSELIHSFNVRSVKSLFDIGFLSNMRLIWANLASLALMVVVVEVPVFANIFKLAPMDLSHWFVVICLSILPFVAVEIVKFLRNIILKRMIFLWQKK